MKTLTLLVIMTYQSVLALISYNIYPVVGEIFQMNLRQFIGQNSVFSISDQSVFTVNNYGTVINNNVNINGTIISTAKAQQYGNPNIPENKYSYLVEVYNESDSTQLIGYQLYEGELQSDGFINPTSIGQNFNPSNTSCYTTEYIQVPLYERSLIAAVCITDTDGPNGTIGLFYSLPYSNDIIYMPSNNQSNFPRSEVQSIETQVTVSLNGETYLSVLFVLTNGSNNLQVNLIDNDSLQFLQWNFTNEIVSFYLATDLTLFILEQNSIIVYNFTNPLNYTQIAQYNISWNGVVDFDVFQTATNTADQLFYIAITDSVGIIYMQYLSGNFYSNNQYLYLLTNGALNIFISPYICILLTENLIQAFSGPLYPSFTQLWNQQLDSQQLPYATFDYYNNVLILALNNQTIQTVQFTDASLTTPSPVNTNTPNGSFILNGYINQENIEININYYVVNNSNQPEVYQVQDWLQTTSFADSFFNPSKYFTGPNLTYTSSFGSNSQISTSQIWTVSNISNIVDCTFVQYIGDEDGDYFLYIYQINNGSIYTFGKNCYILYQINQIYCEDPYYINFINESIAQIYTTQYSNQSNSSYQYIIAVLYTQPSTLVTLIQTPYIFYSTFWQLLTTVNITELYNNTQFNPTILSIAPLYNILYIVTSNPSTLLAVQVNETSYYQIANTSLQNYAPQNIWVDQDQYGELIFMDNVNELVILQLVNQTFFAQINVVTYPTQNYSSLTLGFLGFGFFLTFQNNANSNIYYYPYSNFQTISLLPQSYTTTPGTFNYPLNLTISATSKQFQYFVSEKTLLVYQLASSSVGSLYTTYNFIQNISSVSAVSSGNYIDIVTVQFSDQSIWTLTLLYTPTLQTNIASFDNQYLIINTQFQINVSSSNVIIESFNISSTIIGNQYNYTISNSTNSINNSTFNITPVNDKLDSYYYENYPYPYYFGPIDQIVAQYPEYQNEIINVQTSMVQGYDLISSNLNEAFYQYSNTSQVIAQNLTGSYIINITNTSSLNISQLFIFPNTSLATCPYVGEYNSTLFISVCSSISQQTIIYIYNNTYNNSTNLSVSGVIEVAFFQNNVLTLCSSQFAYVCVLNFNTTNYFQCSSGLPFDQIVYNIQSIETIQIYNPIDLTQNFSQSYGLLVPQGSYIQFFIIGINDETQNNNLSVSFSLTNSTSFLSNSLEMMYSNYSLSQIYSINQMVQTSQTTFINSMAQVPVFLALIGMEGVQGSFGLNLTFNISEILNPTLDNISLQCGYGTYPLGNYFGTTAVNGLIVSLYVKTHSDQQLQQLYYLGYRSSNFQFGGNGTQICYPEGENIQMVYQLGTASLNFNGSLSYLFYPYLTVLPNGQVFSVISNQVTQFIQLSPAYGFNGTLPSSLFNSSNNMSQVLAIQMTAQNPSSSATNLFYVNFTQNFTIEPTPTTGSDNNKLLWIILGSCLGGIILIGVIVWLVCNCKNKQRSDLSNKLVEL